MSSVMPSAIQRGTPAYLRANLALFLAGFATFSLLYCVQPLLPAFARTFQVSPAESSLAMSLSTSLLAFAILVAAIISSSWRDLLPNPALAKAHGNSRSRADQVRAGSISASGRRGASSAEISMLAAP